jgi:hypothetical protein
MSDLCGTVAGMVTPKGNISTEGETLQVSVVPNRCSIAPLCRVCLGCCVAEFGISGGTYELPCIKQRRIWRCRFKGNCELSSVSMVTLRLVDTRSGNFTSVFIIFQLLCISLLLFGCLFCILLWVWKRCCMTNGRIVISENIRLTKTVSIAIMRNIDHYNSHEIGSTHSEKYIFAEEPELIFYNEICV